MKYTIPEIKTEQQWIAEAIVADMKRCEGAIDYKNISVINETGTIKIEADDIYNAIYLLDSCGLIDKTNTGDTIELTKKGWGFNTFSEYFEEEKNRKVFKLVLLILFIGATIGAVIALIN